MQFFFKKHVLLQKKICRFSLMTLDMEGTLC